MPGGQSSSFLIPLGKSLSSIFLSKFDLDRSTGLVSFFTRDGAAVVDELVEDVVDKVGERGVACIDKEGVADMEFVLRGVAWVEATADAAAAKAAAAIKAELCKKGEEKKDWSDSGPLPWPPKVGLRILSMEKAKGLMTLLFSWEELCKGRGKKGWKNEVGVGLIGKSGGELTSLLSSSSSISSLT
jgi:hypothetical protein